MKIIKKYASISLLLLLTTTMTPLNGNLEDDLIDKEALRQWCKQYISEDKLKVIETGLIAAQLCLGVGLLTAYTYACAKRGCFIKK